MTEVTADVIGNKIADTRTLASKPKNKGNEEDDETNKS